MKNMIKIILLSVCISLHDIKGEINIEKLLQKNGIVPDILSEAPNEIVTVKYPNGVNVAPGVELTPTSVKAAPSVTWNMASDGYYTLLFIDPDVPSRTNPVQRNWLHWLVVNIVSTHNNTDNTTTVYGGIGNIAVPDGMTAGNNTSSRNKITDTADKTAGNTKAEYIGAGPGEGSGLHRYVFLVYLQPGKIEIEEPVLNNTSAEGRSGFSVTSFVQKYNLSTPIAGNYFLAQYDDSVPLLYEQLGLSAAVFRSGFQPLKSGTILVLVFILFLL